MHPLWILASSAAHPGVLFFLAFTDMLKTDGVAFLILRSCSAPGAQVELGLEAHISYACTHSMRTIFAGCCVVVIPLIRDHDDELVFGDCVDIISRGPLAPE